VVIWGGEKVFAAGADVKMMAEMTPAGSKPMITALQDTFNLVEEIPKVTIAAIVRFALGGGLELAMCADFRFAAAEAQLGQPEIKLGVIPGAGGTQRLPRLVGPARAKDIIYSGRFVPAQEALRIGLVDEMHPSDQVFAKAMDAARTYARGPTAALRAAKVAVNWGSRGDVRSGLVLERELFADLFSTTDQSEGMAAFVEKRDAAFTGR
jgi:enoyl-CoA hydratase/carnithine racemase